MWRSVLLGACLSSGLELAHLHARDLIRFASPGQHLLFLILHLCIALCMALPLAALFALPALLTLPRPLVLLSILAGQLLLLGLGFSLSFYVSHLDTLVSVLACAPPALVIAWVASHDLLRMSHGLAPHRRRAKGAACLMLSLGGGLFNQHYLPGQMFHFHAAVMLLSLAAATLGAAYLLGSVGRGSVERSARAAILMALLGTPLLLSRSNDVRHALCVLSQQSMTGLHAARRLTSGRPVLRLDGGGAAASRGRIGAGPRISGPCPDRVVRRVVLITVDSLRADHLRLHGYARETAPRISRLGAEGTVFEWAFTVAPKTRPALRALFSVVDRDTTRERSLLLQALRAGGVRTSGLMNASQSRMLGGWPRGFDDLHLLPYAPDGGDRATGQAARALLGAPSPVPMLVFVHLLSPHLPYLSWPDGPRFGGRAMDRYDEEIFEADRAVGEVLAGIDEAGARAETVVMISSDHGEELLDHGGSAHDRYGMFNEELHVPLVIRVPGVAPGRVAENVSLLDYAPTILDLLGVCGHDLPGRSLLPALLGRERLPPGRTIATGPRTPFFAGAIIDGPWKLTYLLQMGTYGLYHFHDDPRERLSLFEARPEVARRLRGLLEEHLGRLESAQVRDDL